MLRDQEIDRLKERALKWIGEELRRLRLKCGLTQFDMEERGVSYKYYQRIEAGRANVTIRTLVRVMRALDSEFSAFFAPQTDEKAVRMPEPKGGRWRRRVRKESGWRPRQRDTKSEEV